MIMTRQLIALLILIPFSQALFAQDSEAPWGRFRGPNGAGIVAETEIPTTWTASDNVRWSTVLPGPGSSSPVIAGDSVLVTSYSGYGTTQEDVANPEALTRHLTCLNRATGEVRWQKDIRATEVEDPYQGFICEHGYASSTPATDGKMVVVLFGKTGLFAFDMDGNELWKKNVGTMSDPAKWGDGTSPILYKDLVIVNAGILGHKIVAFDRADGSIKWEVENENFTNCWSTPIVVNIDGHDELVFSYPGKIMALSPEDGQELWTCESPITMTVCASLAEQDGNVFAMGGRAGLGIGVKCGGKGDVTQSHRLWEGRLQAGIGTPLGYEGRLYWQVGGKLNCADCKTGETVYQAELGRGDQGQAQPRRPAGDYSSAIAVGDRLIVLTRSGQTHVVKAGPEFELIASNVLPQDEGPYNSTPAVADDQLFIRSNGKIYCIANKE
jgi:outer membrane protein assembly factor BamB